MKKIDIKALFLGVGVYIVVNILNAIIDSWVKSYVSAELFGQVGAYSFEDQVEITNHPIYFYYDFFSSILELVIACSVVAYYAKHSEKVSSFAMSTLIAFFGAISWYGQFPSSFVGMFLIACVLYGLVAIFIGFVFCKIKDKKRAST